MSGQLIEGSEEGRQDMNPIYQAPGHLAVDRMIECFSKKWALDFFVSLLDGPKHETDIAKKLNVRYRCLHITAKELTARGLILHTQSKGSKTFSLTDKGRDFSFILLSLNGRVEKRL